MKKEFVAGILLFLAVGIFIGMNISKINFDSEEIKFEKAEINGDKIITNLLAVDDKGKGVSAELITEVKEGDGLVLVNINNVLADYETQNSARVAAAAASNYTKIKLNNLDVVFNIKANASLVAGPSAGSSMAAAVIAALDNKGLNREVVITGTISEDGKVGQVGGILEKAEAAKSVNAKLMLVPEGEGKNVKEYVVKKSCGKAALVDYCKLMYEPVEYELGEKIGIEIKEVKNIKEVMEYYYGKKEI